MTSAKARKTHRRTSTQWNPAVRPVLERFTSISLSNLFASNCESPKNREIRPNVHEPNVPRYRLSNFRQYAHNDISTTKYNLLTFVPLNLFYQVRRVANIYFIIVAALQFIPQLHIATKFVGIVPIAFVMLLTALKDAYEDFRRHRLDQKINRTTCHVWDSTQNRFRKMLWQNIIVGDIVHLSNDETIPADILIIKSSDPHGQVFVETANLDGETNLKQLSVLPNCCHLCAKGFDVNSFKATILCGHPTKEIGKLSGSVEYDNGKKDYIRKGNVMLRGCQVRNTTYVDGIVLYAGKDTKAMLNNGNTKNKVSSLERTTNRFVIFCIGILVVISIVSMSFYLGNRNKAKAAPYQENDSQLLADALLNFVSLLINYQVLIPLSLYISIEVIRGTQLWLMTLDSGMYHLEQDRNFVHHSLNIPEELGQIKYVLSDKTGTLTENRMIFKHCSIAGEQYPPNVVPPDGESEQYPRTNESLHELIKGGLSRDSPAFNFFLALAMCNTVFVNKQQDADTVDDGYFENNDEFVVGNSIFFVQNDSVPPTPGTIQNSSSSSNVVTLELGANDAETRTNGIRRTATWRDRLDNSVKLLSKRLRSFKITTPPQIAEVMEKIVEESRCYEAESPDDLSLVYAARAYGFTLKNRSLLHAAVELPSGDVSEFDIVKVLPFDSTRKRMSVVVREKHSGCLTLFCKGADSAILSSGKNSSTTRIGRDFSESAEGSRIVADSLEALKHYATDGLRTLCVAMRSLEEEEFKDWLRTFEYADRSKNDEDDEVLRDAYSLMENNLELIGITAIEDRLQDNVEETISSLRQAGIQVWVLTGDKLETAMNIARSCSLFSSESSVRQIDRRSDVAEVDCSSAVPYNLVLNPDAIDDFCQGEQKMVDCVRNSAAVLCYRMTPAGKADIVKAVKKHLKGKCLAIGDGANDVPMIQTAHVGIGITGMEGMQAAMASDFAIARFCYLRRLLLVHGHWSYYRIASSFLYFLYKNAMFVFVIFWFQFFNNFSADSPFDPLFSTIYPIIFTSVQPVFLGIFDQDGDEYVLSDHPRLYKQGRQNKLYRVSNFVLNMLDALWQSAAIFFIAYGVYNDTSTGMWSFSFQLCTGVFMVNSFHLLLLTASWTMPLVWMNIFFMVFYFGFHFVYSLIASPTLKASVNPPVGTYITSMTDRNFWYVLLLTTVVALLPRVIAILMMNTIRPNDVFAEQERKKSEIQSKTTAPVICGRSINFLRF